MQEVMEMYILSKECGLHHLGKGVQIVVEDNGFCTLSLIEWDMPQGNYTDLDLATYPNYEDAQEALKEIARAYAQGVKVFEL